MKKYKIYAGLGGSFGGATLQEVSEFKSESAAYEYAYELACQEYESYEGLYGLADLDTIAEYPEDYGLDKGEADEECLWEAYVEARYGWLNYWVEEVDEN